jgi:mannose-1-phosphate guanylyltransferase
MLHAIIMAGGSGTRFWPESRRLKPKQLLALSGDQTMIQATLERLGDAVPESRRFVLTNQDLVDAVAKQLPTLPVENIIGEPAKRDTAPCVALAAAIVQHRDAEGIMVVMPSDHVIADQAAFRAAIATGVKLIEQDPTRIVTFGIRPTYPAESFGYIERDTAIANQTGAFHVKQFREKPNRETAQRYVDAGSFYWNSGIFLWKASTISGALEKNVPEIQKHICKIAEAMDTPQYAKVLQEEFTAIKGKSIDYAVMETYPNVVVIEAPFDWDDVGSWQAIARMHPADRQGNTVVGSHLGIDTSGCIIRTHGDHTIVTIDVDDLIIVQTEDATLVARKSSEERVREVVQALQDKGLGNKL